MIGRLKGNILFKQPPSLLLDIAGVGYELEAPMSTFYHLPEVGETVSLFTHFMVREDAQSLFGFVQVSERDLFRSLLKVNGVGARVALAVLSTMQPHEFVQCVQFADSLSLTRVPGIGKKTAERIILDMRDRVDTGKALAASPSTEMREAATGAVQDAISALIALGYRPAEAGKAVDAVSTQSEEREELIRYALQNLAQR